MSNIIPPKGKKLKWYWYVGGATAVAVVYYAYRRNASNAAATPVATTDTSGTDLSGTYGDPGVYSPVGVTPSLYGYQDPTTGVFVGGTGGTAVVTAPSTNGQWAQQAEAFLSQQGFEALTVAVALGKYLSNQDLTNDQLAVVQAAIAFEGSPPQAVPAPHVAPPVGQTPATGLAAPHLSIAASTKTHSTLQWTAVPGATSYHLHKNGPGFITVTGTNHTVNRPGIFYVVAVAGSKSSKLSNVVHV